MHIAQYVRTLDQSLSNDGCTHGQAIENWNYRVQRNRKLDIFQGNGIRIYKVCFDYFSLVYREIYYC